MTRATCYLSTDSDSPELIVTAPRLVLDCLKPARDRMCTTKVEGADVANLYRTSKESKTLEIEETTREGLPFRILITLRKLGIVTALDYFVTSEEAEEISRALSKPGHHTG